MLVRHLGLLKLCSDNEYPEANSDDETRASEKGGKSKKKKKVAVSGVLSSISLLYGFDKPKFFR